MAEAGFTPKGPVINPGPRTTGPGDAPLPGFRRMSAGEAAKVVGDWSDGQPPFTESMRATVRYRRLQEKLPAIGLIALGAALGLPLGHYLRPEYWIGLGGAFLIVLSVLYLLTIRARLKMMETSSRAEKQYVDLEVVAPRGLTGLDAAALMANPNLRRVAARDGSESLSALQDKPRHLKADLVPPIEVRDKTPANGGAA